MQTPNGRRFALAIGVALAIGMLIPQVRAADEAAAPIAKVGADAPDFVLKGVDGKTYKLSDYRDKLVVLEWVNQDCPYSNYKRGVGPRAQGPLREISC